MGAADQIHVPLGEAARDHARATKEGDGPVVVRPTGNVLVWFGPQQDANDPCVRHVRGPHKALHHFEARELRGKAAEHADDLLVDDPADRQAVEDVAELLPDLDVVAALAHIVEAENPGDGGALVVPAQQKKVLGVLDFTEGDHEGQQRHEGQDWRHEQEEQAHAKASETWAPW